MTSFEELTSGIANGGMSRRDGLKLALGGAAFAALSTLGLASAEAAPLRRRNPCRGKRGDLCNGTTISHCTSNANCYCFENIGHTTTGCGCNTYCSTLASCVNNAGCASGTFCIDQNGCGCTTGVCLPKCAGINKNCVLSAGTNGAGGRTAAMAA